MARDSVMFLHWGGDWPRELFLTREAAALTTPWTRRKYYWVLALDGGAGPIVANCETYTVPSVLDGDAGCVHILTSVFVDVEYRGRGYGTLVTREVLAAMEAMPPPPAAGVDHAHACALFSEIGTEYYARLGFRPALTSNFDVRIPVAAAAGGVGDAAPPPLPAGTHLYPLRDPALPELAAMATRGGAGDATFLEPPPWLPADASRLPPGCLRTEATAQQAAWHLIYSRFEHMHAAIPPPPSVGVLVVTDDVAPGCPPATGEQVAGHAVWKADFDHGVLQLLAVSARTAPVAAVLVAAARDAARHLSLPAITAFLAADDPGDGGGAPTAAAVAAAASPTARWLLAEPGAEAVPRTGALPMYRPAPKPGGGGEVWGIRGWSGVERVSWC